MNRHSDQTKAQVILDWQSGTSLNDLVERYNVPKTTIARWTKTERRVSPAPKNKPTLDEMAYDLVAESFRSLIAIARKAQDDAWLQEQRADGLHLLFGVVTDKLIRLLGAIERSPVDRPPDDQSRTRGVD